MPRSTFRTLEDVINFMDSKLSKNQTKEKEKMPRESNKCALCGRTSSNLLPGENRKKYCPECVRDRGLIQCSAPGCDKYMMADEAHLTGKGFLCQKHFEEQYFRCSVCGNIESRKTAISTQNDGVICQTCFHDKYFVCEDCGSPHKNEDKVVITYRGVKKTICPNCRTKNYTNCSGCGELVMKKRDFVSFTYYENGEKKEFSGCQNCASKTFTKCNSCGNWYPKDYKFFEIEGSSDRSEREKTVCCEKCFYNEYLIRNYMYKPSIRIHKRDAESSDVLFGVEDEIEILRARPGQSSGEWRIELSTKEKMEVSKRTYVASEIAKRYPEFLYQKNDGSLSNGIEIVSHPATLEYWLSIKDSLDEMFKFLRDMNCEGERVDSAGMHIHISRAKMSLGHRNALSAFVHGNREFIEAIGKRRSNHYSQIIQMDAASRRSGEKELEKLFNTHNRYHAVNWCNKHTVEIRIFRSTVKVEQFLSNIEFCKAMYDFTKERSTADCLADNLVDNFKNYVGENNYVHLTETLRKIR